MCLLPNSLHFHYSQLTTELMWDLFCSVLPLFLLVGVQQRVNFLKADFSSNWSLLGQSFVYLSNLGLSTLSVSAYKWITCQRQFLNLMHICKKLRHLPLNNKWITQCLYITSSAELREDQTKWQPIATSANVFICFFSASTLV